MREIHVRYNKHGASTYSWEISPECDLSAAVAQARLNHPRAERIIVFIDVDPYEDWDMSNEWMQWYSFKISPQVEAIYTLNRKLQEGQNDMGVP